MLFPLFLPEISIDDYVDRDRETRLGSLLADNSFNGQDDQIYAKEVISIVHRALIHLTDRERFIIINRFGLNGDDEQTLEQIGKEMNLSRERVRQLEKEAKIKLRDALINQKTQLRFSLA